MIHFLPFDESITSISVICETFLVKISISVKPFDLPARGLGNPQKMKT